VVVVGGVAVAALLWWPHLSLARDPRALARVSLPAFAGHLSRVEVRDQAGKGVPAVVRGEHVWPSGSLAAGEALTIRVAVDRPGWAAWLVGRTEQRIYHVRTPVARLRSRWPQIAAGRAVIVSFAAPVRVVRVRIGNRTRTLRPRSASRTVALGVTASGAERAGSAFVSAVARPWERQPTPVRVTWFPASRHTQARVQPSPGARLQPGQAITLTFSKPVASVVGAERPVLTPTVPGHWRTIDTHTLSFEPAGLGYPIGAHMTMRLALPVAVTTRAGSPLIRSLRWQVPDGSVLRLQQLLARAGYLPLDWRASAAADPSATGVGTELAAVSSPPSGRFTWRFSNTPRELKSLWRPGRPNEITRAAIMMFQDTHHLEVDSFAGPNVWHALLTDTLAGIRRTDGYSYVYVHRKLPQSLNLWHNGRVILRSPGNTGVPAAPTQLGSFPVFEHIPVGTMSGTNPDGSHYHDPGIRYISYFNHGDAIHAFNRASFGTPQSLGCVELPLKAAAKVWPYTPIGTLVTVEN
jgi:peptidoglycan hydrolase-like protein with peptidoglycan-binding domain